MISTPTKRLGSTEFIALMAMLFATVAFSIDAMLPAMSEIAAELTPEAPNRAQLIITSFVLGMGLGTLFTGPLSDRYGRKPVILGGAVVYITGAALAWAANSLETVLLARFLGGLGAAGPRVAAMAIVRDLYEGREMARIMSFAMMVFSLVPAIAPLAGAAIIELSSWREIFVAFAVFSTISAAWLGLRQPETLTPEHRRAFSIRAITSGVAEVFAIRRVALSIAALSFVFAILFTTISTTQQVFDQTFDKADEFPWWFGVIALISATGSLLNARIVVQLGMRKVIAVTLAVEAAFTAVIVLGLMTGLLIGPIYFPIYLLWLLSVFFVAGLTIGNLNALGMEPLGHMAGLAASIIGAVATVAAVILAIPMGFAFDGTPLPIAIGILLCSLAALVLTRLIEDLPS